MSVAWSTKQLADLAGVTLRSIRHWHDVGLLPQPARLENGYKQYTARHLILALRIARLTGLGFTLERVGPMLDSEQQGQDALHELRAELAARIAELERIRSEVDELIGLGVAPDLSPDAVLAMEALGQDPVSRNVAIVLTHLAPREDTVAFVELLRDAPAEIAHVNAAILELPADASEREVAALAERAITAIGRLAVAHGDADPGVGEHLEEQRNADVLNAVATEGMNAAQRRVMQLIVERLGAGAG